MVVVVASGFARVDLDYGVVVVAVVLLRAVPVFVIGFVVVAQQEQFGILIANQDPP